MKEPKLGFFIINLILLFVVIGFILIVFDLNRVAFVIELALLLIAMLLLGFAIVAIYHNKRGGWTAIAAVLFVLLLDIAFILLLTGTFETWHLATGFFTVIGLIVALINLRESSEEPDEEVEEYNKEKNYYPYIDKMEPEIEAKAEQKLEKTFTPGRFVASKKANKFHAPKCDWAKRIVKSNQIWFNSKQEAEAQGLEADRCIT